MRFAVLLGALGVGLTSLAITADDAKACGGCFAPPTQDGDVVTDHRMILSVGQQQTTLYDEIEYQGDPQSFAWVLPIHGPVTVGLSADTLFAALDSATQTSIQAPVQSCPVCDCGGDFGTEAPSAGGSAEVDAGASGVNVISQSVVGPYETVQLQSTNPTALTDWLTQNGFDIPAAIDPVIAGYVQDGFDFLALKLVPGQGVQAMRPVRVTTSGAGLSLPLRMVAAGTGATVGITLWVVGQGRYEAQNFPNFTIAASDLVWDFSVGSSDYSTIQQQKESAANFATWQTESSLDLSPYQIENPVLYDQASDDYQAVPAADGGEGGSGETADQVRQDDLAALFPDDNQGTVRITRMRADLAHAALATDLVLQASADQSPLSNLYQVTQSINAPACSVCSCPPGESSGGGIFGNGFGGTSSGQQSGGGCSTGPSSQGGAGWLEIGLAGLLGVSLVRSRVRRGKKTAR